MSQPGQPGFKLCPSCGNAAALDAAVCVRCGHTFQTQFSVPPPPPGGWSPYPRSGYSGQPFVGTHSKIAAGLFAILLGGLGVHRFYLGDIAGGFLFLVGSILGLFLCGIPSMVLGVIALVQGILYLVASDAEFHQKYVVERRWF